MYGNSDLVSTKRDVYSQVEFSEGPEERFYKGIKRALDDIAFLELSKFVNSFLL